MISLQPRNASGLSTAIPVIGMIVFYLRIVFYLKVRVYYVSVFIVCRSRFQIAIIVVSVV